LVERQEKILQLLDASGPRLHRLLARLTRREDVTGDLLQELFLRLWNSRSFEKAQDPFAYACRSAINLAFEWRREHKKTCRPLENDCPGAREDSSALCKMIRAEELTQVLEATSRLTNLARDVVVMRYIQQDSYEEIAARLGKTPQHIRSICAKAMAQLRRCLARQEK
jgi:RNA polymerase sigma-70 factor (ECF subfamily)